MCCYKCVFSLKSSTTTGYKMDDKAVSKKVTV